MKLFSFTIKTLITCIVIMLLSCSAVFAESEEIIPSITIAPSILDLDVEPGQIFSKQIFVTNNMEFALPIRIVAMDYTMNELGIPDYFSESLEWVAGDWVDVEVQNILLRSSEKRDISLEFEIPTTAQSGSYFATILFQPVFPSGYFKPQSAHIIPYIGAIVSLNVAAEDGEGIEDFLEIRDFGLSNEEQGQVITFAANLKNNDVFYHKVEGVVTVSNIIGKDVGGVVIDDTTIMPENLRMITAKFEEELSFGKYIAKLTMGDGDFQTEKLTTFWILPGIWNLSVAMVTTMMAGFLVWKRKNIVKAVEVLVAVSSPDREV